MAEGMEKEWHYAKDGRSGGPVPESTIRGMIASGDLGPDDHVWNPDCVEWLPIRSSPFARYVRRPASPVPPAAPASSGNGDYASSGFYEAGASDGPSRGPAGEPMAFGEAIKVCLAQKYATFTGRATRAEYWWFMLFNILCSSAAGLLGPVLPGIVNLVFLLPCIAVSVRRLHDINKSGWFYLLWFIPIVGWIFLIIWFCTPSDAGMNRYGE